MSYKNFGLAIYCTVGDLTRIDDIDIFAKKFEFMEKHLQIDKVYLETYRGGLFIEKEKMLKIKEFFNKKGIKTSGGITTTVEPKTSLMGAFCYTTQSNLDYLRNVVEFTAGLFDELILDDFYFTNCRCESCIAAKGSRSWSEFRTDLMRDVSENYIIKPAKKINPNINVIIKFPNWYENYQDSGYNLKDQPKQFDMIYTGTETRDPENTQQHLPRYLSYFVMRYLENVKPGKNGGGWFDPFGCTYSLNSYAEQAYLTLFSKPKEVTLFCLGMLLMNEYRIFVPMAGYVFETVDSFIDNLGNPQGVACYLPYHSYKEDYLHNYVGMLGIPLEPQPDYPSDSDVMFLTASAAFDKDLVSKIKASLREGKRIFITSGLLSELEGKGLEEITSIRSTGRKAYVNTFAVEGGVCSFKNHYKSAEKFIIPQIDYATNDSKQVIVAMDGDNNFPVLLESRFGKGYLYVLAIPDNFSDLYNYPAEVLTQIRALMAGKLPVFLGGESRIGLFVYDNDTFVIESFLSHNQDIPLTVNHGDAKLVDIASQMEIKGCSAEGKTKFNVAMGPGTYRVFKIK
ncbi:MAG: permease [Bacillota bacterium]|nr:permease [Bacillota bacterium]